jgi:hypothetical protein
MDDETPKDVADRQRQAGVRDPFPRGQCPRCGRNVALVRDRSRTMQHDCWTDSNDDLFEETHGNGICLAVDMGTGAIVGDPTGEAAAGYQRLRSLDDLKVRLRDGAPTESVGSITAELKTLLLPPSSGIYLNVDEVLLVMVALARQSLTDPASAPLCRSMAEAFCPGPVPIGHETFNALLRALGNPVPPASVDPDGKGVTEGFAVTPIDTEVMRPVQHEQARQTPDKTAQ